MHKSGHLVLVKTTLSAMPIYTMISISLPPWLQKVLVKIFRAFLWSGTDDVHGGKCVMAWCRVARLHDLGGPGVLDLNLMGRVLQLRWLWLSQTDPSRSWAALPIQEDPITTAFFKASIRCTVGNGHSTSFWTNPWVDGQCIADFTPDLFEAVAPHARKR
jgi:hypothetical protein